MNAAAVAVCVSPKYYLNCPTKYFGPQDVVGINTEHKGLSVRLLRSASLLGMMHLYRFGFVVGVLQVWHTWQQETLHMFLCHT